MARLGIVAVLAIAVPQLAGAATPPPPRSALQNFGCHQASDSLNRWISVTGVMRPVPGTKHMAIKFELLHKRPSAKRFVEVSSRGTDLGKWISPHKRTLGQRPGDVWRENKPVVNLPAPADYRLRVSFRWMASAGRVLGTVVRLSAVCRQR